MPLSKFVILVNKYRLLRWNKLFHCMLALPFDCQFEGSNTDSNLLKIVWMNVMGFCRKIGRWNHCSAFVHVILSTSLCARCRLETAVKSDLTLVYIIKFAQSGLYWLCAQGWSCEFNLTTWLAVGKKVLMGRATHSAGALKHRLQGAYPRRKPPGWTLESGADTRRFTHAPEFCWARRRRERKRTNLVAKQLAESVILACSIIAAPLLTLTQETNLDDLGWQCCIQEDLYTLFVVIILP